MGFLLLFLFRHHQQQNHYCSVQTPPVTVKKVKKLKNLQTCHRHHLVLPPRHLQRRPPCKSVQCNTIPCKVAAAPLAMWGPRRHASSPSTASGHCLLSSSPSASVLSRRRPSSVLLLSIAVLWLVV